MFLRKIIVFILSMDTFNWLSFLRRQILYDLYIFIYMSVRHITLLLSFIFLQLINK